MKKPNKFRSSAIGFLALFLPVTVTAMSAVLVYSAVNEATSGNKILISITIIGIIIVIALACVLIELFRRRLMIEKPLRDIQHACGKIAKGDFTVRLKPLHDYGFYDEYDQIKVSLNKIAEELGRSRIMNMDFIANVSHELKTPLAVIGNYATALSSSELDEETRTSYTDSLVSASNRLSNLVTNVLKLSKLENGALAPEKERFDASELLRECTLRYESVIEDKNLELDCEIEDELFTYSTPSYYEIIFSNLLSNAFKFSQPGGKVEIKLTAREKITFTVRDYGCGINEETGARIFEKFYQGDTSHASEGNGLGLALVKKVIDLLGGEMSVQSKPNEGSTFRVTLFRGEVL
ncbi:MAG: HAMP domain-containing histidine kinase [Clostridia bacterium]|nr:HAMP domain-containing histidine kinase [Clostridia bacterium]